MKIVLPHKCCGRCHYYSTSRGMRAYGFCLKHKVSAKARELFGCFLPSKSQKKYASYTLDRR